MSNQTEQLQNDLKLIQEVQRHTNLYDPRCKDKDSKSRDNTWSIIGEKLNLAPDACKNRWKNLRDKYTREKKLMMIEGEESYRNHPWPLLDEMSFLWNFVSHRNRPQIRLKNYSSDGEGLKYDFPSDWVNSSNYYNDCDDNSSIKPNFLDPACVLVEEDEPLETNDDEEGSPPRSKLRRLLENKIPQTAICKECKAEIKCKGWSTSGLIRHLHAKHNINKSTTETEERLWNIEVEEDNSNSPKENGIDLSYQHDRFALMKVPQPLRLMDEEEYFCMSLAASLKRLPKQKSSLLKIKIMQILYEAQFGEDNSS